ncbi:MAG TPA: hypothetical protein VGE67_04130 [Haloferula sp.]
MNLRKLFGKKLPPGAELKSLYEKLSDEIDGPASLQYAVVDGYLGLRSQANRDGWMNWSGWYEETVDILRAYLPEGAGVEAGRIRKDLDAIREAGETGADEGRFAYEEVDRLAFDVVAWCNRNQKLIQLPDGVDSWIDTVGNSGG